MLANRLNVLNGEYKSYLKSSAYCHPISTKGDFSAAKYCLHNGYLSYIIFNIG